MEALVVSQILLWILVVVLALVVLGLARQIGVLHERVAPLGALTTRTAVGVGDPAPVFDLADLAGAQGASRRTPSGPAQPAAAVRVASPVRCARSSCRWRARSPRASGAASTSSSWATATGPRTRPWLPSTGSQELPLILSPIVGITLGIGKLPHAVLIDAEGVIRSSGIVNSREHLESLLVAQETGWASMQDYLLGTRPAPANGAAGAPEEARRVSA